MILNHILRNHYSAPKGFDFEAGNPDQAFPNRPTDLAGISGTEPATDPYHKAQEFSFVIEDHKFAYASDKNIIILMGDDFRYVEAETNYESLDNLIATMNEMYPDKYYLRYSTPSDYLEALQKEQLSFRTRTHDIFPMVKAPMQAWSGFFTTRPNLKRQMRITSQKYHASNQIYTHLLLDSSTPDSKAKAILATNEGMLDTNGINMHHDAITGTSRPPVVDDYAQLNEERSRANDLVYADAVGAYLERMLGLTFSSAWEKYDHLQTSSLRYPTDIETRALLEP